MKSDYNKTMLLVKDEALIAISEQKELEKYGYDVLTVVTKFKILENKITEKAGGWIWEVDLDGLYNYSSASVEDVSVDRNGKTNYQYYRLIEKI